MERIGSQETNKPFFFTGGDKQALAADRWDEIAPRRITRPGKHAAKTTRRDGRDGRYSRCSCHKEDGTERDGRERGGKERVCFVQIEKETHSHLVCLCSALSAFSRPAPVLFACLLADKHGAHLPVPTGTASASRARNQKGKGYRHVTASPHQAKLRAAWHRLLNARTHQRGFALVIRRLNGAREIRCMESIRRLVQRRCCPTNSSF